MSADAPPPPTPSPSPAVKKALVGLLVFFCLFVVGIVGVFGWAFVRVARAPKDASRMTAQGPMPLAGAPVLDIQGALRAAGCERVNVVALPAPPTGPAGDAPRQLLTCLAPEGAKVDCELVAKVFLAAARPQHSFLATVSRGGKPGCMEMYTAEGVQRGGPGPGAAPAPVPPPAVAPDSASGAAPVTGAAPAPAPAAAPVPVVSPPTPPAP